MGSRHGVGLVLILALAGCLQGGPVPTAGRIDRSAPREVAVSGREIVITGPEGFCVDPRSVEDRKDGVSFVLMGNCASISNSAEADQPPFHALLSASVRLNPGAPMAGQMDLAQDFLRSEDGRALLSRTGDPDSVTVIDSFAEAETLYLRARDSSEGYAPNMSAEHWRAIFDVRDRVIAVAVYGFDDAPLPSSTGLSTVRRFADAIRAANQAPSVPEMAPVEMTPAETAGPVDPPSPAPQEAPATGRSLFDTPLGRVGLLRRILG